MSTESNKNIGTQQVTSEEKKQIDTYKYFYNRYQDFEKKNPDESEKFRKGVAKFAMEKLIPSGSPYVSFPGAIWLQVTWQSGRNHQTKEKFIDSLFEPSDDRKGQAHFMLSKLDMFNFTFH